MLEGYRRYLATKRIVLASASPRRQEILRNLGLRFEVVPSSFAENLDKSVLSPAQYVTATASAKAEDVFSHFTYKSSLDSEQQQQHHIPDLIISADTIVVREGEILEKPTSEEHAKAMLRSLSGREHSVMTAVALIVPKEVDSKLTSSAANESSSASASSSLNMTTLLETTRVHFTDMSAEMIDAYVASGAPMDKAGGYGIQDATGGSFVRRIEGCYYNVVGFPLHRFCLALLELLQQKRL
ncbi:Acetylserotonin O-methyltransferase like [Balamuthia mandrillaris]